MRPSKLPGLVLVLWLISVLLWWGFAFLPTSATPPEWLVAARAACFGTLESGLPAPYGWMLLALGPASFLVGILVLWGAELGPSVLTLARAPVGAGLLVLVGAGLMTEGLWITTKIREGLAVSNWTASGSRGLPALPATYPRQTATAPDFTLVDQGGKPISLGGFRGKPVLLTFVFAHCQDLCPLLVQSIKEAASNIPPSEVLLVTLDPWRDTPSSLAGIARQWDVPENFHILSSRSVTDVLGVIDAYRVPFERNQTTGDIAHPGLVFLVDTQGRLAYTFNNPPVAWIREGLARLTPTHADAG